MNTSRVLTSLALATAASLTYGCGSSSFKSCQDTRSCSSSGTDGGIAGNGGMAGSTEGGAGTGGAAGSGGSSGTAGTGGAPGLDDNGATCGDGSSCKSGNCVDGVCCNTACDGTCEACDVSGSEGTCTPYASGTDPESECLGSANAGDPCAGACDGSSGCSFPDNATACGGSPTCNNGKQTTYGCGGDGSCAPKQTSCGNYVCGASVCRTSCTGDAQCASSAWCNPSNKCVARIADGGACGGDNQCKSGHCIGGACCHTSCAAPSTCSTGTCLCNGVACASGHACITWYLDQDDDGYGASSSYDKVGCDNLQPPDVNGHHYVLSSDDCDDTDARVHKGQTGWFTSASNGGTWDYNCNGIKDPQYPTAIASVGATCMNCAGGGAVCFNGTSWGYECSGPCASATKSYKHPSLPTVGCGQSDYLYTCTSSGGETKSSSPVTQGCH